MIGAHITLILDNLKTFLEKGVKFENLSLTIDILLFISKKYPSQFNLYFKVVFILFISLPIHLKNIKHSSPFILLSPSPSPFPSLYIGPCGCIDWLETSFFITRADWK